MFQSSLTVAFRNLSKNKIYSTINIAGLAMGITAFLFILEYVSLEKSVNKFHAKLPNLARMMCQNAQGENWPQVEPGWAEIAKSRLPEIKSYCRFVDGIAQGVVQNQLKNLSFREQNLGYVEGNFFDFFSFPLLAGQALDLNQPDAAFISASIAEKILWRRKPSGADAETEQSIWQPCVCGKRGLRRDGRQFGRCPFRHGFFAGNPQKQGKPQWEFLG